jgi:hypothetical protein
MEGGGGTEISQWEACNVQAMPSPSPPIQVTIIQNLLHTLANKYGNLSCETMSKYTETPIRDFSGDHAGSEY